MDTGILDEVPIHLVTLPDIIEHITHALETRTHCDIGYVNAHVLNLAQKQPSLLTHLQSLDICYCDGLGPVLALKAHGFSPQSRLPGRLCIPRLLEHAAHSGWRIGWVGGAQGVLDIAVQKVRDLYPSIQIPYTTHGFQEEEQWATVIAELNQASVDILLVGMGSPIQESWLTQHRSLLDVPVTWTVGATADYMSGIRPMGPSFLLKHQEWLARFVAEPRRMWRRYLIGNPKFVLRTTRSLLWKK